MKLCFMAAYKCVCREKVEKTSGEKWCWIDGEGGRARTFPEIPHMKSIS
jgi:hypothetical protein